MTSLYESLIPRVARPARYTGGELNSIVKDWDAHAFASASPTPTCTTWAWRTSASPSSTTS